MFKICLKILLLTILTIGCNSGVINTKPTFELKTKNSSIPMELPENYVMVENVHPYKTTIYFVKEKLNEQSIARIAEAKIAKGHNENELEKNIEKYKDNNISEFGKAQIEKKLPLLKHLNVNTKSTRNAKMKYEADTSHDNETSHDNDEFAKIIKEDHTITSPVDLLILIVVKQTTDVQKFSDRKDIALYSCILIFQIIEIKGNEYEAIRVKNPQVEGLAKRYRVWSFHWDMETRTYIKEFEQGRQFAKDLEDNEQAKNQAFCRAVNLLVNKLGGSLPCGGQLTNFTKSEAKIEVGKKQGVMDGQIFIIYTKNDGNAIPVALAEASVHNIYNFKIQSSVQQTALKIFKWSNTPFASKTKKEVSDKKLSQTFYAASIGMPEVLGGECVTEK